MPAEPLILATPALAAILDLSPRRVQQLAAEGVLQSEAHGSWDATKAVPAYIAHRLAQETARTAQRSGGAAERHVTAKARAVELRTARDEGVLCDTAEAVAVVEEVLGTIRSGFGGLAARVTRDLALRDVINSQVDDTLERAAKLLARRATELRRGGEPPAAAPAEADAEAADVSTTTPKRSRKGAR